MTGQHINTGSCMEDLEFKCKEYSDRKFNFKKAIDTRNSTIGHNTLNVTVSYENNTIWAINATNIGIQSNEMFNGTAKCNDKVVVWP